MKIDRKVLGIAAASVVGGSLVLFVAALAVAPMFLNGPAKDLIERTGPPQT